MLSCELLTMVDRELNDTIETLLHAGECFFCHIHHPLYNPKQLTS